MKKADSRWPKAVSKTEKNKTGGSDPARSFTDYAGHSNQIEEQHFGILDTGEFEGFLLGDGRAVAGG